MYWFLLIHYIRLRPPSRVAQMRHGFFLFIVKM